MVIFKVARINKEDDWPVATITALIRVTFAIAGNFLL